jgi:hypothetical protein
LAVSLADSISVSSLEADTQTINKGATIGRDEEYIFASKFDGADADSRLDNTLTAASDGDVIFLENKKYTADRTISKRVMFFGTAFWANGTEIDGASWTLDTEILLRQITIRAASSGNSINMDENDCRITDCAIPTGTIAVSQDECMVTGCAGANNGGQVTFESGTTGGIVDACARIGVTDNGTNTVGDIS